MKKEEKKLKLCKIYLVGTYMAKAKILEYVISKTKGNEITEGSMLINLDNNIIKFLIRSDENVNGYRDKTTLIEGKNKMEINGYDIRKMVV